MLELPLPKHRSIKKKRERTIVDVFLISHPSYSH